MAGGTPAQAKLLKAYQVLFRHQTLYCSLNHLREVSLEHGERTTPPAPGKA